MNISFIGAGRWATTLALILNRKNHQITMWEASAERYEKIIRQRTLPDLPDTITIPSNITITNNLEEVLASVEIIVLAVPSQALRNVLTKFFATRIDNRVIWVSAIKGIENQTYKRMSEIIKEFFPDAKIAVLAGPGIPYEIALGLPASLVVASSHQDIALRIQQLFSYENLRCYTQSDVVGTELGGSIKNVIAIAAGICDGLQLGENAKAALLTRGLAEMTRLGIAMNANPMTFAGLAGIGDLIVTSYSPYSRNRYIGEKLGQGIPISSLINSLTGVAEGIATATSAKNLSTKMHLDLPVINEVFTILSQPIKDRTIETIIKESIGRLMSRPLKSESE
ncbi:MAG: NAD(P)-dependent glycerol-3-phosphate dehydrogenase [candidate division WOR-3 bacterium]|nr:NAD(P)-dependent glycerol-3-phosphate dehydrogenase [candidate division WOR-3 bacterium]